MMPECTANEISFLIMKMGCARERAHVWRRRRRIVCVVAPTIVTTNYWDTIKLDDEDADWVTKNCVVVNVTEPVFETTGAP